MKKKDKKKKKSPAYQYYPKDHMGSERVKLLSLAEEGAYGIAKDYCWLHKTIPADPKELAKLIGKNCTVKIATVVLKMFLPYPSDPSRMFHDRLEEEREKQEDWSEKASNGGKKSAAIRQQKLNGSSTTVQLPLENSSNKIPTETVEDKLELNGNTSSSFASSSSLSSSAAREGKKTPSQFLQEQFAKSIEDKAMRGGMDPEKIPEELEKFDTHHQNTEFTDVIHMLNAWGIWCLNYLKFQKKPTGDELVKKNSSGKIVVDKPESKSAEEYV